MEVNCVNKSGEMIIRFQYTLKQESLSPLLKCFSARWCDIMVGHSVCDVIIWLLIARQWSLGDSISSEDVVDE